MSSQREPRGGIIFPLRNMSSPLLAHPLARLTPPCKWAMITDMTGPEALARGRDAFARESWSETYHALIAADSAAPLEPEDLERLAAAANLVGEDATCIDALTRAHHGFLERADAIAAARNAVRLAFTMFERPALQSQATGWLARARRLFDECATDCADRGFLLCAEAVSYTHLTLPTNREV